ncbi:hypothetical protein FO433_00270 [Weissella cibaria]|uniref:Uncharacterized protein n=3 Tax=Weissella TaxID=46255 RepID=A0A1X4JKQ6_9LACO|nr:FAD-dependent oxidoreductase [Weissella cibaria]MBU7545254.1 FAD-dependent oxidoreductase [Weissella cibaria]MCT8402106.1 hypothetical protein [Weissella cibaria]MCV3318663.1 FAD-dependent oxidoreductase [Weissella cibaria]MDH5012300.1 FAD-dependent oxidoreductase [Weissella cibaria]OSP89248.1 hypothetical protein B9D04_06720 [Weissella cibaria]
MKVVIVGASHAGIAAAQRVVAKYADAEVTLIDRRTTHLSFIGAGAHMYLNGEIESPAATDYCEDEQLQTLGVDLRLGVNVLSLDADQRLLSLEAVETGEQTTLRYDRLILATGSTPRIPAVPGFESKHVHLLKRVDDVITLRQALDTAKDVANQQVIVLGGGLAGTEAAMAMRNAGAKVTLLHNHDSLASGYFDHDFSERLAELLIAHGIDVVTNVDVRRMEDVADRGVVIETAVDTYAANEVIVTIGMLANTMTVGDEVTIGVNRSAVVDEYMYTTNPYILAVGDAATSKNPQLQENWSIMHASGAVRQGILAAENLLEKRISSPGSQAAYGVKLFDWFFMRVGVTADSARFVNRAVAEYVLETDQVADYMVADNDNAHIWIKVIFDPATHVLLGVQMQSKRDFTEMFNMMAVALNHQVTLEDLAFSDMMFEPHANTPLNFLSDVALRALDENEARS